MEKNFPSIEADYLRKYHREHLSTRRDCPEDTWGDSYFFLPRIDQYRSTPRILKYSISSMVQPDPSTSAG